MIWISVLNPDMPLVLVLFIQMGINSDGARYENAP